MSCPPDPPNLEIQLENQKRDLVELKQRRFQQEETDDPDDDDKKEEPSQKEEEKEPDKETRWCHYLLAAVIAVAFTTWLLF